LEAVLSKNTLRPLGVNVEDANFLEFVDTLPMEAPFNAIVATLLP
jgi:hypothetical protein